MASKFPPAKLLAPDRKRQRRPVLQAKLGLCPPPARRFQAPSPVCTLEPGSPSLPSRGQDTGPKAQGQPQPDCPQGAETTGRGNPSSCPSPKSLVAASAQRERASADSGASQEAHTRPISQLEFPSGEPSGTASRPGSGREGVSLGNVGQESQGKDLLLIRSKQTLEWSWKNFSVLLVILNFGSAIDNIMTRLILSHTWTSFSDFELPWTSLLGLAGDLAKQQSTY
ncbi:Collagen alpha-1(I) chain precursor-like protein [Cricetulus griseus]|nr:Collagen alpha-1(I) chain precursor-like protein [Cricetulus griseus]